MHEANFYGSKQYLDKIEDLLEKYKDDPVEIFSGYTSNREIDQQMIKENFLMIILNLNRIMKSHDREEVGKIIEGVTDSYMKTKTLKNASYYIPGNESPKKNIS